MIKNSSAEIRLTLLKNFDELKKVVGLEQIAGHLSETIRQLVADKRWRIRMSIAEYAPIIARALGTKTFQEQFGPLYLGCLDDNVFAVREVITKNLKDLVVILGPAWTEKYAVSKLTSYKTHTNYLYRLNPLFAIPILASVLSQDVLEKTIVPFVLNQVADKIPNIRFNVAKCLKVLLPLVKNSSLQTAINKTLIQLASDSDPEVKYFASKDTSV